jgi:LIVCS family branched-chain amino acid:cation transporter
MFFGAGNLIFPPFVGLSAGPAVVPAFLGMALSAVGLPILGVIAVARVGDLPTLADRVGRPFAAVFTMLIYLSVGPCLAIPRTASTSFEMAVTPFLPSGAPAAALQAVYSAVFFGAALALALRPSKLVDWLGKRLAPVLLALIAVLFVGCLFHSGAPAAVAAPAYQSSALSQGFLDGYQTMDAIVALIFGVVLTVNIRARGVTEQGAVEGTILRASWLAAALFLAVYGALTYIGAAHGDPAARNGAQLLSMAAQSLFGKAGGVILAVIFVIACLNTCISLICSCGEYFHSLFPKVSYRVWAGVFALVSAVISNAGLNLILKLSVPILNCLYPAAIALIALAFLPERLQRRRLVYPLTVGLASVFGVLYALDQVGIVVPGLTALAAMLPLYQAGLGWLLPAIVGALGGLAGGER